MFYKVLPGSETFLKVQEVREKIKLANRHFQNIANELGTEGYSRGSGMAAGRPKGYLLKQKPEGWVSVGPRGCGFYFPKSKHPDYEKLTKGPEVSYEEVNRAFGTFVKKVTVLNDSLMILEGPTSIFWDDEAILFEIHEETDWVQPSDVVEIKGSEYLEIKAQITKRSEE